MMNCEFVGRLYLAASSDAINCYAIATEFRYRENILPNLTIESSIPVPMSCGSEC